MRKKYFNLYDRIWSPGNLWQAFVKAARGKRSQPAVAAFEYDLEAEIISLENDLRSRAYQPGAYHNFTISKPKHRLISAAPFRDRVAHHALMNVIEPLFERQFIFDSYANRTGKGTHRALDRCTHFLRRFQYVMHLDVRQFFPSVDHQILQAILAKTIGDPDVLELTAKILDSGAGIQVREYSMVHFLGDDLFSILRKRGLPIGNLTSQHWANVYLNELDQFAKRVLKVRAYIRFVDDILLFADRRECLRTWRGDIIQYLHSLRLTIHENSAQSRQCKDGITFLGFQVFPEHRRIKPRNGYSFRRRLKGLAQAYWSGKINQTQLEASLQGWLHHASHADTWALRRAIVASSGLGVWEYG